MPTGARKAAKLRASNHVEPAVTNVASIKRELPSMLSGSPIKAPAGGSQPPAPAPAPPVGSCICVSELLHAEILSSTNFRQGYVCSSRKLFLPL